MPNKKTKLKGFVWLNCLKRESTRVPIKYLEVYCDSCDCSICKEIISYDYSPVNHINANYKLKEETMNYGKAIELLRQGKAVARQGWNGNGMFVCKQTPSEIYCNIIPKMQSLPDRAKEILFARDKPIHYQNQMIIVKPDNTIDSWVASSADTFAEDWMEILWK